MSYIRTNGGNIYYKLDEDETGVIVEWDYLGEGLDLRVNYDSIVKEADTIEELCDCFVKIKRNKGCKDYILKFDHKDLSVLRQQRIKYPTSPVYGAIHVEDKGLIYVAKMDEKGEFEPL